MAVAVAVPYNVFAVDARARECATLNYARVKHKYDLLGRIAGCLPFMRRRRQWLGRVIVFFSSSLPLKIAYPRSMHRVAAVSRIEKYRYHDFRINVNYVCLFSCNIFTFTISVRIENCTTEFSFFFLFFWCANFTHFSLCLLGK